MHLHNPGIVQQSNGNWTVLDREFIPGPDDGAAANRTNSVAPEMPNLSFVGTYGGLFSVTRTAQGNYAVGLLQGDPALLNDPQLQSRAANWDKNGGLEFARPVQSGGGGAVCR